MTHVHEWYGDDQGAVCGVDSCEETLSQKETNRRLNANEWLYRMGNEDIAAELSASWDLPLHITRGIADWILKDA